MLIEEKREQVKKMSELLLTCKGTRSLSHQLQALLARVETFLENVGVSDSEIIIKEEVLSLRLSLKS